MPRVVCQSITRHAFTLTDNTVGAISASQSQRGPGRPARPSIPQDASDPPSGAMTPAIPPGGLNSAVDRAKIAEMIGISVNRKKAVVEQDNAGSDADEPEVDAAVTSASVRATTVVQEQQSRPQSQGRSTQQQAETRVAQLQSQEASSGATPRTTRSSSRKAVGLMCIWGIAD